MKKIIITLVLTFIIGFGINIDKVSALTLSVTYLETGGTDPSAITPGVGQKYNVGVPDSSLGWDPIAMFRIDGQIGFCIEPLVVTQDGEQYSKGDIAAKLDPATRKKMEQISYMGYGYNGDISLEMYAATQIRIWQVVYGKITDIHPEIQAKIDLINNRLKYFDTDPSFAGTTLDFSELKIGKENAVTLTDTCAMFQYYQSTPAAISGIKYEKNGNDLKVWMEDTSKQTGYATFNLVEPNKLGTSQAYLSSTNKQAVAIFKMNDPYAVRVNAHLINKVTISKQDSTNKEELPGATLTLTEKETGKVIDTWVSTDTPHVIDGTLLVDGKEYVLKETIAPDGYEISEEVTFTYDEGGENSIVMLDDHSIENPVTGISNSPIVIGSVVFISTCGLYILLKKKNILKKI